MVGAGPSFEDHVALIREQQGLREVVDSLDVEVNELEGLVAWYSIHLPDAEANPHLKVFREEVIRKRKELETVVKYIHCMYMYMYLPIY